jgi:hypothetical protein
MSKLKQISHKIRLSYPQVEAINNLIQSVVHLPMNNKKQMNFDLTELHRAAAAELMVRLVNRPYRDAKDKPVNQMVLTVREMRTIIACSHLVNVPDKYKQELERINEVIAHLRQLLGEEPIKESNIILIN